MSTDREFPKIYFEFEGRKVFNGQKRKYWIQDATEDMLQEDEDLVVNYFFASSPTMKYLKVLEDPVTLAEFRLVWRKVLQEKLTLVCLTKVDQNNTKLAGFNVLSESIANVKSDYNFQGASAQKLFKILTWIESQRNFHKEFKFDRVMKGMGLYVLEDYRGEALEERILEAREHICRHVGIHATLTGFTSVISQKLAARVGFQDFYAIDYEELGRIDPAMHIPDIQNHSKMYKSMYKIYN